MIFNSIKRALVLAPHTDDGEFGCGATIDKLIKSGVEVYYIAFSYCEESVPEGFAPDVLKHEAKRVPLTKLAYIGFPKVEEGSWL